MTYVTAVLRTDEPNLMHQAVEEAVRLLREGEVVALPTETVYGLAANALDPAAVTKIFEAKERPTFDPLIVHLPNKDQLDLVAELGGTVAFVEVKARRGAAFGGPVSAVNWLSSTPKICRRV